MTSYYFDSSALVKRYAAETGTEWVRKITSPSSDHILLVSRVTGAEIAAAIWRKVREGNLSRQDALNIIGGFRRHLYGQYHIVEITAEVVEEAMNLITRYGLRGYDGIQLASAKLVNIRRQMANLPPLIFVCADVALLDAARAEGLLAENPADY
ncbi:MAG: type II toxin-antitoxin system VapC family toxin [Thermoflexales bacterium]|nr:type II toxin-antitoxin system VapC family toxin [Thermoflexales bacterium]